MYAVVINIVQIQGNALTEYPLSCNKWKCSTEQNVKTNIWKTTKAAYDTICSAIPTHCLCVRA